MGPGETIGLLAICGVIVGLLIAGAEMFKRHVKFKERQLELTSDRAAEKAAQYAAQVERLEARMRVLERIATDKGAQLAGEIEDLRDEKVN